MSEETTKEVALNHTQEIDVSFFPSGDEATNLMRWMDTIKDAPYYKKMGGLPAMISMVLTGRELGTPPMRSLNGAFWDIQGRIVMSAEEMRTKVRQAGHSLKKVSHDLKHCTLIGKRNDNGDTWEETFTWEDAERAKLTSKDNWVKSPKDMLLASATRKLCRALFSDVLGGTGDDSGEVIDITPQSNESVQPDIDTLRFIDKFELLDLTNHASQFIDSIAANMSQSRHQIIKQCAKDSIKFENNLKAFIKKIEDRQRSETVTLEV